MQRIMLAETPKLPMPPALFRNAFQKFHTYANQADDTTGSDKS